MLHSLYRIADLTVVPSIYEPFGLVALEAMASGCPCLVADTGGLREVVPHEDVGLRFRSRDPESLARWPSALLTDDELRDRLVAEAYEHVLQLRLGRRRAPGGRGLRRGLGPAPGHPPQRVVQEGSADPHQLRDPGVDVGGGDRGEEHHGEAQPAGCANRCDSSGRRPRLTE